jgi:6-phosphogluconolactonase (cycloisomerase 2 family)
MFSTPLCPSSTATLVSIAVVPVNPDVTVSNTQQFIALGTYSDASVSDITALVTWASTNPAVATISNALGTEGQADTLSVGSTSISATLGITMGSTTLTVNPSFAYVGNGPALTRCSIVASGDVSACVDAGVPAALLAAPNELFVDSTRTHVYATNFNALSGGAPSVIKCDLAELTGVLSACADTGGLVQADGNDNIDISATWGFAYIPNQLTNVVTRCVVSPVTGALSSCIDSGAGPLSTPHDIVLNESEEVAYLVTDAVGDRVMQCDVNTITGALSGCFLPLVSTSGPISLALRPDDAFLYIAEAINDRILRCAVNNFTGQLDSCVAQLPLIIAPTHLAFNETGSRLYVLSQVTEILSVCEVDLFTGELTSCMTSSLLPTETNGAGVTLY